MPVSFPRGMVTGPAVAGALVIDAASTRTPPAAARAEALTPRKVGAEPPATLPTTSVKYAPPPPSGAGRAAGATTTGKTYSTLADADAMLKVPPGPAARAVPAGSVTLTTPPGAAMAISTTHPSNAKAATSLGEGQRLAKRAARTTSAAPAARTRGTANVVADAPATGVGADPLSVTIIALAVTLNSGAEGRTPKRRTFAVVESP